MSDTPHVHQPDHLCNTPISEEGSSASGTTPASDRHFGPVLDICPYGNMIGEMARAATTSDVFNAIAEPQRRAILALLRGAERPVSDVARQMGMTQPRASKHLRVLREVGLVTDRQAGKQRLYSLDARGLRPVHEWTGGFERFWNDSFDRLEAYARDLARKRSQ